MFQMVRPGSVSGASHLLMPNFFFSFFFGPGSVQKRKDINLLPMRNKPKFSKKKSVPFPALILDCIVFHSCQSTENVYTKWEGFK